jgi:hypothetical protein
VPATISDPWHPRSGSWSQRPASEHAGRADRPLLIGGCPRSGTTLLRSLLDNHPGLAVPAESNFVIPLWNRRAAFGDLRREENRRAVAEWIFLQEGHGGKRIRGKVAPEDAIARVVAAPPTLGSLFEACFALYAERTGKPRWGDKRPRYATFIQPLFRLFPDAQFVNVVRDPRAAVASMMPLGWDPPEVALEASIANWELSVRRVDEFAGRLRPDQLLDVRYEDLVRDPGAVLEQVCAFASLPAGDAVDAMLSADRGGSKFKPGWHDRLREPISTAPIDSWRARLADPATALVEHVCGPWFERFGYVPVAEGAFEDAALREVDRQRGIRRDRLRRLAREELKRRLIHRRPVAAVR